MNDAEFLQFVVAMALGVAFGYPIARAFCFVLSWAIAITFALLGVLYAIAAEGAVMIFNFAKGAVNAAKK